MKASDRTIILGVVVAGLAIAFYLLALGPKRDKASELSSQISDLHASISEAQQQASYGQQARQDFPRYYGRMVVLGKAVPAQSDTASMLVELNSIADHSKMDFRAISLSQAATGTGTSSSSAPTSTPATPSSTPTTPSASTTSSSTTASASSGSSTGTAATPSASLVPATEASAANLPIGAVVGSAGLPTLPYSLALQGNFFDVANFIGGLDGLVRPVDDGAQLSPNGRLFTVNGFALKLGGPGSSGKLDATFSVTTYVTGDQGLTAGASPSGPASPATPQAQPASAAVGE